MYGKNNCPLRSINIELTTECPLRCPQCYCQLGQGKSIDFNLARKRIIEAGELGVSTVLLSGGETLCYPQLYELIKVAKENCGNPIASFSGALFTQEVFEGLIESGLDEICISLNGSSKAINNQTRDGFDDAITALKVLQKNKFKNTTINWVMHCSNADDFPNMILIAEQYGVAELSVLGLKPDYRHQLRTLPSSDQLYKMKKWIRQYQGELRISVESCYSPLRAVVAETKLFGNMNLGAARGCSAGLTSYSINVDGAFSPCRHLEEFEYYPTTKEYLNESKIQRKLRNLEQEPVTGRCVSCKYQLNCKPCQSINHKIDGVIQNGINYCPIVE